MEQPSGTRDNLTCPNCGAPRNPELSVCIPCGAPLEQSSRRKTIMWCRSCGRDADDATRPCRYCGGEVQTRQEDWLDRLFKPFGWVILWPFGFDGRINRTGYLIRIAAAGVLIANIRIQYVQFELGYLMALVGFFLAVSASARRAHDLGFPGWWGLGILVPLLQLFLFYVFLTAPGSSTANEYSEPPSRWFA